MSPEYFENTCITEYQQAVSEPEEFAWPKKCFFL